MEDYNKKIDKMAEDFVEKFGFVEETREVMKHAYCIGAREVYTDLIANGRIKTDTELS